MLFDQYWFRTGYGTIVINTFVIPYFLFGPNRDHFPWITLTIPIPISIFTTDILVPIFKDQDRCFVYLYGIFCHIVVVVVTWIFMTFASSSNFSNSSSRLGWNAKHVGTDVLR